MARFYRGVQGEVLLSLALVMATGTALLAAIFLEVNRARIDQVHELLGRGFASETRSPGFAFEPWEGASWWRIAVDGRVAGLNRSAAALDPATRSLGEAAAVRMQTQVETGAPWSPIRFATPDPDRGGVLVARLDAPLSGRVLAALIVVHVLVFVGFGLSILRSRVVGPVTRLAAAVHDLGTGSTSKSVPAEGAEEIARLGTAFNEMQHALTLRTNALERAVSELRTTNANLLQAREGLDRAERLALVGSLAAGVAHEVGNPMGALLAFLDLADRDPGLGEEGRRCLARASEQGERIRIILRQLLDFSRPPRIDRVPISLAEVAEQVVQLVHAQKRHAEIDFEVRWEKGSILARGDASLASQVLLNLVLNAAAAVEGGRQQRIRLEVRPEHRHRRDGEGNEGIQDRRTWDAVACLVGDSGPGVAIESRERIFDPFFTTRDPGQGTGLGLANARRLAQEMGGGVDLAPHPSELGGALFRFTLPAIVEVEVEGRSVRAEDPVQSRIP